MKHTAKNDPLFIEIMLVAVNDLTHSFFIQHFTDLTNGLSEMNCIKCPCNILKR